MQQYYRFKRQHPECVLLFRMGDFYEMFDRDAEEVSRAIGLTLTQRTAGVPMAGVPYHQLDGYVRRLLAKGYRVAIAEQMEDASAAKGLVKRAVTRVLTPGTLVEEAHLSPDAAGTLAAVLFTEAGDEAPAALAVVDASTGVFVLTDSPGRELGDELVRRGVRELLYAQTADGKAPERVRRVLAALGVAGTPRPAWQFRHQEALDAVKSHLGVSTLAGFGLRDDDAAIGAAGALLAYLTQTQAPAVDDPASGTPRPLGHLRPPRREERSGGLIVDAVSLRALEVERTIRGPAGPGAGPAGPAGDGSLLGLFHAAGVGAGRCRTSMGRRLLRDWLVRPLADLASIEQRQDAVAVLVEDRTLAGSIAGPLEGVQDVARIAGRLALGRATPRDLVGLGRSLEMLIAAAQTIEGVAALAHHHAALREASTHLAPLAASILDACVDAPPATLGKTGKEAGLFRDGVDAALDEARLLQRDAGSWLVAYQQRLVSEHNLPIASGAVKVGFNQVFGYYIELSTAQARSAPSSFIRKQTLKNAERYTTPELREFEAKAMSAEARASERERALFDELCRRAASLSASIAAAGAAAAELDALLALADRAVARGWTRPCLVPEPGLEITSGRHPVLELSLGANFVPNDLALGPAPGAEQAQALALITGPNMAGKSTFIRQTALIVLLAHAGSFVPAERAVIGLTDRIFTRVGADDALFAGHSTFMVEMTETANILHHATPKSLVILDEIGRGTSTLDGLALAWAIAESLAGTPDRPGPRTLFATHYHEITRLADDPAFAARVRNLHVVVREWPPGDEHAQIVFLHRIMPGRADQSYGVHVARLAGIPPGVVARARVILASLSVGKDAEPAAAPAPDDTTRRPRARKPQMPLFEPAEPHPALAQLREIKLEAMSPIQAWDEIRRLKQMTDGPG
jgi:DNA mismatch repair protein MutS